jgi:hypothetical protein
LSKLVKFNVATVHQDPNLPEFPPQITALGPYYLVKFNGKQTYTEIRVTRVLLNKSPILYYEIIKEYN